MSSSPIERPKKTEYKLDEPFEYEGTTRDSVTFRRVKGKDIEAIDGLEGIASTFKLMSILSGESPAFFKEMDAIDIEAIGTLVEGFMGKRRRR